MSDFGKLVMTWAMIGMGCVVIAILGFRLRDQYVAMQQTVKAYQEKYPSPPILTNRQAWFYSGKINGLRVYVVMEEDKP